jgi:hypothetical protein
MDIRVNDDTIPKKTINMILKTQYVRKVIWKEDTRQETRLGCQAAHTKVETLQKLAVTLS